MQNEVHKISEHTLNVQGLMTSAQSIVALMVSAGLLLGSGLATADEAKDSRTAAASAASSEVSIGEFIDQQIRQGWSDNEIEPSAAASDEEWMRRIYLDLLGRIPTLEEARAFLKDESPRKRAVLTESLLEHEDYVRNFTTIWSNNCVSRKRRGPNDPPLSRPSMEKFFREAFAKNRPWNDIVFDLITAAGHFEENGAVNYILAQTEMDDDGVLLTATTSRLFLGTQVQCTQCHNHPFNKWQQEQFWELNSFFRQVDREDYMKLDPTSGRRVNDYSEVVFREFSGPVDFEKRSGIVQVVFPKFQGRSIDPGDGINRRVEFAKLLNSDNGEQPPQIATAFVNRMWGHFFGYGFTRPIDDLGPHNPPSHPELLEKLAREFAASEYNVKQLIRWIVTSEAYSLTSKFNPKNGADDPAAGEMPLFSHMYLKSMQPEQMYDSLIVASNAHKSGRGSWASQEDQRRKWLEDFVVVTLQNDENEELTTFNGTIPQALFMMNHEMIDNAVSIDRGSFLFETMSKPGTDAEKISDLFLATLCRPPSRLELRGFQKMLASYGPKKLNGYQDLFWALLNSNEFVLNH